MICVGENEAIICKGDFAPAALYKGDTFIAGAQNTLFEGELISAENTYNAPIEVEVQGKSEQDAIPTPDVPVDIQKVLSGTSINVSDVNDVIKYSATSEYDLYSDDKWNVGSGEYVFDKAKLVLDGTENWDMIEKCFRIVVADAKPVSTTIVTNALCSHFKSDTYNHVYYGTIDFAFSQRAVGGFAFTDSNYTTVTDWKSFLADQYSAGTPVTIVYQRAVPLTVQGTAHSLKSIPRHTNIFTTPASGGLVPSLKTTMKTY